MPTVVIRIDMPPKGVLEETGRGFNPIAEEMVEERQLRQAFLDAVSPTLASLPGRPSRRVGNVLRVEMHCANIWSQLNHYLVMLSVDIGEPNIDWASILPPGAQVTTIGSYIPLREWPEDVSA